VVKALCYKPEGLRPDDVNDRTVPFEFETAVGKLESCVSPGIYVIPSEQVQTGGDTLRYEIHTLIYSN
jgi:hypothetical protein